MPHICFVSTGTAMCTPRYDRTQRTAIAESCPGERSGSAASRCRRHLCSAQCGGAMLEGLFQTASSVTSVLLECVCDCLHFSMFSCLIRIPHASPILTALESQFL